MSSLFCTPKVLKVTYSLGDRQPGSRPCLIAGRCQGPHSLGYEPISVRAMMVQHLVGAGPKLTVADRHKNNLQITGIW